MGKNMLFKIITKNVITSSIRRNQSLRRVEETNVNWRVIWHVDRDRCALKIRHDSVIIVTILSSHDVHV